MTSLEVREEGLDHNEVVLRLKKFGYNEISSKKPNLIIIFLKKFWGFTPLMLITTIILEIVIGKLFEAYFITALLIFNSFISFFQQKRANSALEQLKGKLQIQSKVKRQGKWTLIPAREIVPDDIIRLRTGDFVPADIIILEGSIKVDQSSLTGESFLIEKDKNQLVYSGSIVRSGEATGITKATATQTLFGRTIQLVEIARPKLHIQSIISNVVKWLIVIVIISIVIAIVYSIIQNLEILNLISLFVVLLIASIPIALPTMFTISMALGSLELSKKGVLITRLDAVEDAAMMNLICIDKTGTLTANLLKITELINNLNYEKEKILLYGALASKEANQDPIDLAFIEASKHRNLHHTDYIQKEFIPFEANNRRTESLIEHDGERFYVIKGAVNVVFDMCNLNNVVNLTDIQRKVDTLSASGYRLIAVAKGKDMQHLELIGVAALFDQIRPGISTLIKNIKNLGISLKMLTGDVLNIAKEVGKKVGIGNNIVCCSDLEDNLNKTQNIKILENINGFAEVYPEDKFRIVKNFQNLEYIVGMTGDGVNDAPALKQSEVGIAVKDATDVAKRASSVVLTKETLQGIIDLIKIGRKIYRRIDIWILNKIIRTFKRVLYIVLAFMIFRVYVVSTLNMIILLFLSDYVTLSLSTDQVSFSQKPENANLKKTIIIGVILGIFIVLEGLIILFIGQHFFNIFDDLYRVHTYTFTFLVYSGYFTILIVREKGHFWHSKPSKFLSIILVINSILVYFLISVGLLDLHPISIIEILIIITFCFIFTLIINDLIKYMLVNRFKAF